MAQPMVGLLTTRSHPLLPYLVDRLVAAGTGVPLLILDEKDFSAKDAAIFQARTGGAFPVRSLEPFLGRIPWVQVPGHNSEEAQAIVTERGLRLLVNAGTPRRIGARLLNAAPQGVLNVHPGVLPKYRGASCCEWALYHDEPVGVTAHFMDEGLDSGPIILVRELSTCPPQSYEDVRVALYRLAQDVMVEAITRILERGLTPADLPPQPPGPVFKPIPDHLLEEVRAKLRRGEYHPAAGLTT